MVRRGWAVKCDSLGVLRAGLGADDCPTNRLALVSKLRPDGGVKRRTVWGLRRSLVNGLVRQVERVVLPRLSDLVEDTVDLLQK
eukprot:7982573-Alexandrium_andersonii.AAC.1